MKQNNMDEQALNNTIDMAPETNEAQLECAAGGKRNYVVGWTCGFCGNLNPQDTTRCTSCGKPRYE